MTETTTQTPTPLLTMSEAAAYLGISKSTLAHHRSAGQPTPPAIRIGGAVRYRTRDIDAWLEQQLEKQAA